MHIRQVSHLVSVYPSARVAHTCQVSMTYDQELVSSCGLHPREGIGRGHVYAQHILEPKDIGKKKHRDKIEFFETNLASTNLLSRGHEPETKELRAFRDDGVILHATLHNVSSTRARRRGG